MTIYAGSINRDHVHMLISARFQSEYAAVGIEGGAVSEGEEFTPVVIGVQGAAKEVLGPALMGEGLLGGLERECDG